MVFIFMHAVNKRAVLDMSWPSLVFGADAFVPLNLAILQRARANLLAQSVS